MEMDGEMDLLKEMVEAKAQSSTRSTGQSKREEQIDYALSKVREMMGYFRKGEANDPVRYPLALAEILSGFPRQVIDKVTSPHGIAAKSDFMPSIKELREECEIETRHFDLISRPKPEFKRYIPKKLDLSEIPNLFVPTNAPRYEQMLAKHKETKGLHSYTERRACYDGIHRDGVWVPLGWWEDRASGPMKPLQMPVDELKIGEPPPVEGEDDFVF